MEIIPINAIFTEDNAFFSIVPFSHLCKDLISLVAQLVYHAVKREHHNRG